MVEQKGLITTQGNLITSQGNMIQSQKILITKLTEKIATLESQPQGSQNLSPEVNERLEALEDKTETLDELSKLKLAPSCQHLAMFGISKSGNYKLNMNGNGNGAEPVEVHCDFATNTTKISHDSLNSVEIQKCSGSLCFNHPVKYPATPKQIQNLIDISEACEQDIAFDCHSAALEINNIRLGAWKDKNGDIQNFFDGSDPEEHICKCGKPPV